MNKEEQLVIDNLKLVSYLLQKHYPTFYGNEDLLQSGYLGLCSAAQTFDETRGVKFATYAGKCIMNEFKRYIRNEIKTQKQFSLDMEYSGNDDMPTTLLDAIEAPSNDRTTSLDILRFTSELNEQEKDIVSLRALGYNNREIMNMRKNYGGVANISRISRKIQRKWEKWNGKNSD